MVKEESQDLFPWAKVEHDALVDDDRETVVEEDLNSDDDRETVVDNDDDQETVVEEEDNDRESVVLNDVADEVVVLERKRKPTSPPGSPVKRQRLATCNDPLVNLAERNQRLRGEGMLDYAQSRARSRPYQHVTVPFPAIASKKYDGHMALVALRGHNTSVVLAEMCSTEGFYDVKSSLANGNTHKLYYYIYDVLRFHGCEVQHKPYEQRLAYARELALERPIIMEQRSRDRGTTGNKPQPAVVGLPMHAKVVEYRVVHNVREAWDIAQQWAQDRRGKGPQQPFSPDESVEGAVVSWMGGLSKRYKLKPWYDGDIVVQSLNYKNGKVTSVTGMDPTLNKAVTVKGNVERVQVGMVVTYRRHYCLSSEGKGEFSSCDFTPVFQRERNDDAFEAYRNNTIRNDVPISQLQRKKAAEQREKERRKRHTERGTPNRNIVGRMLECQFKRIEFEDCPFQDKQAAINVRQHLDDVEFRRDCKTVPLAVMQYIGLGDKHPLKHHLDRGFVAVVKGTKEEHRLSVSYDRSGRKRHWYGTFSWPLLHCTCPSWEFGNHGCTRAMQNEGGAVEITKPNELRICKHWIGAINNPDLVDRYEKKTTEKKIAAEKPRAVNLLNLLPVDDVVRVALDKGKRIQVQGSTDAYFVFRDNGGVQCTCPSYQGGSHRLGKKRNAYKNDDLEKRLCKHTLQLFDLDARGKNWKVVEQG